MIEIVDTRHENFTIELARVRAIQRSLQLFAMRDMERFRVGYVAVRTYWHEDDDEQLHRNLLYATSMGRNMARKGVMQVIVIQSRAVTLFQTTLPGDVYPHSKGRLEPYATELKTKEMKS